MTKTYGKNYDIDDSDDDTGNNEMNLSNVLYRTTGGDKCTVSEVVM